MFNKYCRKKEYSFYMVLNLINSQNQLYNQIVNYSLYICTTIILCIHVTSPILGERISAIILTQQRKQWLLVELNRWRSERIHCYFKNNKNITLIIIM